MLHLQYIWPYKLGDTTWLHDSFQGVLKQLQENIQESSAPVLGDSILVSPATLTKSCMLS